MRLSHSSSLAVFRVALGLLLIWQVLPNLDRSFLERLPATLLTLADNQPMEWVRFVILQVALAHAETLGSIISIGQLVVGCALVIGFFVPFISLTGFLYSSVLLLLTAHVSLFHQLACVLLMIGFGILGLGDAGQAFGIDKLLFKPQGNSPVSNKKQQKVIENLTKTLKQQSKTSGQRSKVKT